MLHHASRAPVSWLLACLLLLPPGCKSARNQDHEGSGITDATGAADASPSRQAEQPGDAQGFEADAALGARAPEAAAPGPLVLIAGGDVDLSRGTGQRILRDPSWDPFFDVLPLLRSADLRFANLESPLSDQKGETVNKSNTLVFTGPPGGAEVLTRGRFDIVSTANNHAWDYGKRGLRETIENLDRVGIAHVGTNADAQSPMGPVVIERKGHKVAFLAATAIFNDGPANLPEPRKYVAPANSHVIRATIAAVRDKVDWVVASIHIGSEYSDEPVQIYRQLMTSVVDSGADVVLGHHTHTPQRIEFHKGKPIVYSMGNFVFHQHSDHPWTGWGYLARVTLDKSAAPAIEICPYHLLASIPHPVTSAQDAVFMAHMKAISVGRHAAQPVTRSQDGCWLMRE